MTHADSTQPQLASDDRRARRNAIFLSLAQALYMIGVAIQITLAGIAGHLLADDK